MRLRPDLCVIGAGSGGLSVAAGAVQMGASVVLIEGGQMGGDCLNYGCVPSKALLSAGKRGLGFAEAMAHVAASIAAIAPTDSQERFEGLGCTVLRDWAAFVSPSEVRAGAVTVAARRFVVATGAGPFVPALPGLEGIPYLTNETVFGLAERPGHLVVLGGGPVGVELALAFRRLGSAVTVIEGGRALGREDPEAAAVVLEALRDAGVVLREGVRALSVSGGPGAVSVETEGGRVDGTHLLLALGRRAALERLDLGAAGIAAGDAIITDERLRTSNRRVFAIGDVAGRGQFTHLANYHAGIVLRQALFGLPAHIREGIVPRVTYAEPELAQVGLTEAEAREMHGARLSVGRWDYAGNDRAVTEGRTAGFAKVMVVGGRPVGVTIVGAAAGEAISMWSLAMSARLRLSTVAGTVLPYPTLAEVGKRAAGAYFSPRLFDNPWVGRAVRLVQRVLP